MTEEAGFPPDEAVTDAEAAPETPETVETPEPGEPAEAVPEPPAPDPAPPDDVPPPFIPDQGVSGWLHDALLGLHDRLRNLGG